jgi:hypothetical protein
MGVLSSLDWSGPAIRLLESMRELDPKNPVVMHIRHTTRSTVSKADLEQNKYDQRILLSTPLGIQAAVKFGSNLPQDREYTLYHTYMDRTKETAEGIRNGIIDSGGSANIAGVIPYAMTVDPEASNRLILRRKWYEKDGGYDGACHWIAGLVPETIFRPSIEFAKEYANISMSNLRGVSSDAFHIYVSHDTLILALIFHWFGVAPYSDGVRFLEGLLMQVCDDGLHVWLRDRHKVYEPPYWWPSLG